MLLNNNIIIDFLIICTYYMSRRMIVLGGISFVFSLRSEGG